MTVMLTEQKKHDIIRLCSELIDCPTSTIRHTASVIGKLTSSFPGVKFGPLYYRNLDREKTIALKKHFGNFKSMMTLTADADEELKWWSSNVLKSYNNIWHKNPNFIISTDASKSGWGAVWEKNTASGLWLIEEAVCHINELEISAILFGLQSLMSELYNCHVKILSNNTTAVHCLNKMGTSHSYVCNKRVRDIWLWAQKRNIWLSASHIPGKENELADIESRRNETSTEWKLDENIFSEIIKHYSILPKIELFASRINYQLKPFVSFRPDPEAITIDAFTFDWKKYCPFYAFPPFCIVSNVLQKVLKDDCEWVIIVPNWPNQPWFSQLINMLIRVPLIIPSRNKQIYLPSQPDLHHPLSKKLTLLACVISGHCSKVVTFQKMLSNSYCKAGLWEQGNSMDHIYYKILWVLS